ncbi:MAG: hypothetical protein AAF603_05920 [Pseudomonadota bacterium]
MRPSYHPFPCYTYRLRRLAWLLVGNQTISDRIVDGLLLSTHKNSQNLLFQNDPLSLFAKCVEACGEIDNEIGRFLYPSDDPSISSVRDIFFSLGYMERVVLVLSGIENMSFEDISAITNRTSHMIETTFDRAVKAFDGCAFSSNIWLNEPSS